MMAWWQIKRRRNIRRLHIRGLSTFYLDVIRLLPDESYTYVYVTIVYKLTLGNNRGQQLRHPPPLLKRSCKKCLCSDFLHAT